jgi:hypothetical protein
MSSHTTVETQTKHSRGENFEKFWNSLPEVTTENFFLAKL